MYILFTTLSLPYILTVLHQHLNAEICGVAKYKIIQKPYYTK